MDSIDEVDFELLAKYAGIADKEIEKITRNFEGHSSLNVTGQPGTISHTDARAMAFGAIVALYEFGDITEVQVINPATHKVEIRKTILPDKANAEVKTPPWHPLD